MNLPHLLSIADLEPGQLRALLDRAQELRPLALGGSTLRAMLQGKTVCPLFFEASTRTRGSFMLAAAIRLAWPSRR